MNNKHYYYCICLFIFILNYKITFAVVTKLGEFAVSSDIHFEPLQYPSFDYLFSEHPTLTDPYTFSVPEIHLFDQASLLYHKGFIQLRGNKLSSAENLFDQIINSYQESDTYLPSLFWKAYIKINIKSEQEAEKYLKLIILSPKRTEYFYESAYILVMIKIRQGLYHDAIELLDNYFKVIKENKKLSIRLMKLKIYCLIHLQRWDEIKFLIQKIQNKDPSIENYLQLIAINYKLKNYPELYHLIDQCLSKFHNDRTVDTILLIGVWTALKEENTKIAEKFLWIMKNRGNKTDSFRKIQIIHLLQNHDLQNALNLWNQITITNIKQESLQLVYRYMLQTEKYDQILKSNFDSIYWKTWWDEKKLIDGIAYQKTTNTQKSVEIYKGLVDSNQTSSSIKEQGMFLLIKSFIILKDFKQAELYLIQIIQKYPSSLNIGEYYFWYGIVLYEIGEHTHALMALKQNNLDSEIGINSTVAIAEWYYLNQDWDQATHYYELIIEKYSGSDYSQLAKFKLANILYLTQNYNEAEVVINELVSKSDNKIAFDITLLHVKILSNLNRIDHAIELLENEFKQNRFNNLIIREYFDLLEKQKKYQRIISFSQIMENKQSSDIDLSFLYMKKADALLALNKKQEASVFYEKFLNNAGRDQRGIHYRLIKLKYDLLEYFEFERQAKAFIQNDVADEWMIKVLELLTKYYSEIKDSTQKLLYMESLAKNYEKILKNGIDSKQQVIIMVKIGRINNEMKKYSMAEIWLKQAVELANLYFDKWKIFDQLGIAEYGQQKYYEASTNFLKILYLDKTIQNQKKNELIEKIQVCLKNDNLLMESKALFQKYSREYDHASDTQNDTLMDL
ncbi:MAG: hypothetical protein HQM12_03400 [SAR324 cluster bacterium]|nr:hypothetical protein [SAR324 cluster bacterium]